MKVISKMVLYRTMNTLHALTVLCVMKGFFRPTENHLQHILYRSEEPLHHAEPFKHAKCSWFFYRTIFFIKEPLKNHLFFWVCIYCVLVTTNSDKEKITAYYLITPPFLPCSRFMLSPKHCKLCITCFSFGV